MKPKPFSYSGCTVAPELLSEPILVGCNNSVNRYLKQVWRVTFPDGTWCRVGTKGEARRYIRTHLYYHQS